MCIRDRIYAFEVAAKAFKEVSDADDLKRVGRAIEILASKTGIYGMIGGQTVDVELAGGPIPKNKLDFIYRLKTGALIEASMLIGAVLGGAAEEDCKIVESLAAVSYTHLDVYKRQVLPTVQNLPPGSVKTPDIPLWESRSKYLGN